jgi:hypothetical protein
MGTDVLPPEAATSGTRRLVIRGGTDHDVAGPECRTTRSCTISSAIASPSSTTPARVTGDLASRQATRRFATELGDLLLCHGLSGA